jgi:hypothetical protein
MTFKAIGPPMVPSPINATFNGLSFRYQPELCDDFAISGVFGPVTGRGLVPLAPKRPPYGSPTRPERDKTAVTLLKNLYFPVSEHT